LAIFSTRWAIIFIAERFILITGDDDLVDILVEFLDDVYTGVDG
jgi:hypothetical protein